MGRFDCIIEVLLKWNSVIISQIEQGHEHFQCEGSMVLEMDGTGLHHAKTAYVKHKINRV
jgi:hypothetical protein